MKKINLPSASLISSPNPLCFICTKREDGRSNFASVSWYTYLSYNPGMMAFAMSQHSYSGGRVRAAGQAVLAFPGKGLEELVGQAGSSTGHKIDKVATFGVKMEKAEGSDIEIPAGCAGAILLDQDHYEAVGDHYLYICRVAAVYDEPSVKALLPTTDTAGLRRLTDELLK